MTSDFLRVAAAYAAGLLAPGYLLARALRTRCPWAFATPLSMGLLLLGVLALDAAGVPLRLGSALAWQAGVLAVLGLVLWRRRGRPGEAPASAAATGPGAVPARGAPWDWLPVAGVALVASLAALRGTLAPLSGLDVVFRWDFLARQMLRHDGLAFYPPVGAGDFRSYAHPDGFAPLVSASLWWVYAALGRPSADAAAPLAVLQYGSSLGLAWATGRRLHSPRAGWLAAGILAATPLFLRSVLIGQETGVTALAAAAMVYALVEHDRVGWRAAVLAGAAAGVGGLAREYGLALVACGAFVLAWRRAGWAAFAAFASTAVLVNAPWLVRNVLRCGNPLYGVSLGFLPVNPVFAALLDHYRALFGLGARGAGAWLEAARLLVLEAGAVLVVGVGGAACLARRHGYLLLGAAVAVCLWLLSVGYTSAGLPSSLRVLSPALALLAVAGGIALARWERRGAAARAAVNVGLLAALLHGAAWAAAFPEHPGDFGGWSGVAALSRWPRAPREPELDRLLPPGTRVLGDDAFAHALLVDAGASVELVPVWSPEVAFLFDPGLSGAEQHARLLARGIGAILICPSVNTPFCLERSRLYAEDRASWAARGSAQGGCVVYVPR